MNRNSLLFAVAGIVIAAALSGCGGIGSPLTASVNGIVTDLDGRPARNAKVYTGGQVTYTSTRGFYQLSGVRTGDATIRAELVQDGVTFRGQNVAVTFDGQISQSINIAIGPESSLGSLSGTVRDRNGFPLEGASVFANGAGLSSARALTKADGSYNLSGLIPGITYNLSAGGRTYTSDLDSVTLRDGENRTLNFTLGDSTSVTLPAPSDLLLTSWVAPVGSSRAPGESEAFEAIKRFYKPERAKRVTRNTVQGSPIEIDLDWLPVHDSELLGYGIYRGLNPTGTLTAIAYSRDPLGNFFADADPAIVQNTNYTYYVTSLTTLFPDFVGTESGPSNRETVRTLGDLNLLDVTQGPLTFRWLGGSGAQEYVVFLFDRFPGIGVTSVWNNDSSPVTGASLVYPGSPLVVGRRYYYIVLGRTSAQDSITLSHVGDFVVAP